MSAKFRKLDPRIWNDEKFQQLPPMHKLLAVYCLTAQVNRIGIFKFSVALASEDIGYPPDTLRDTLREICDTLNWHHDEEARVMYFPHWWKYNASGSHKTMKGCLEDLRDIPQTHLLQHFAENKSYLNDAERRVLDTHMQGYTHGYAIPIPIPMPMGISGRENAPSLVFNTSSKEEREKGVQRETRAKKQPSRPKEKFNPREVELPFSTTAFTAAWGMWCSHRLEKKKPLTPTSVAQQLELLSEWGEPRAVAAIKHTVAKGWEGIREDDSRTPPGHTQKSERHQSMLNDDMIVRL